MFCCLLFFEVLYIVFMDWHFITCIFQCETDIEGYRKMRAAQCNRTFSFSRTLCWQPIFDSVTLYIIYHICLKKIFFKVAVVLSITSLQSLESCRRAYLRFMFSRSLYWGWSSRPLPYFLLNFGVECFLAWMQDCQIMFTDLLVRLLYGSFLVPLCDFFFVLPTLKLVKSTLKLVKSTF